MACYLLSEDYFSPKSKILEILHTVGMKTREQLTQEYNLSSSRPLDMDAVKYNYEETEANYRSMGDACGGWHDPSEADWRTTTFPPVRPDYEHAVLRSRM